MNGFRCHDSWLPLAMLRLKTSHLWLMQITGYKLSSGPWVVLGLQRAGVTTQNRTILLSSTASIPQRRCCGDIRRSRIWCWFFCGRKSSSMTTSLWILLLQLLLLLLLLLEVELISSLVLSMTRPRCRICSLKLTFKFFNRCILLASWLLIALQLTLHFTWSRHYCCCCHLLRLLLRTRILICLV